MNKRQNNVIPFLEGFKGLNRFNALQYAGSQVLRLGGLYEIRLYDVHIQWTTVQSNPLFDNSFRR